MKNIQTDLMCTIIFKILKFWHHICNFNEIVILGTPTGLCSINLDLMQKRINSLEEENRALRREYSKITEDTDECEAREQRLVNDITIQLGKL